MGAYYNEFDANAAAWLRELIRLGEIPAGDVDERSILDVRPADLAGYTQCHFFAGIGGWPYALRLAGWPDDRPVWTGSPPCQPFSVAGRGEGRDDARHLAPHFVSLVRACRPAMLFGEQVASSLVIGRSGNKGLHPLWRREEALRFLKDSIERELAQRVSGVPERAGASPASGPTRGQPASSGQDGIECEIAGRETRRAVRSDGGFHQGETGRRGVRGYGPSVLHDIEEGMGLAVDGPDHPEGRLHPSEYEDGPVLCEHGFLRLGRSEGENGGALDLEHAYREVERALAQARRDIESSAEWTWIDSLQSELEGAHYTCGASSFPSCSVGAPHIRQRTFFGAVTLDRLADSDGEGRVSGAQRGIHRGEEGAGSRHGEPQRSGDAGGLADADCGERQRLADGEECQRDGAQAGWQQSDRQLAAGGEFNGLVHGQRAGLEGHGGDGDRGHEPGRIDPDAAGPVAPAGAVGGLADKQGSGRREERADGRGGAFGDCPEGIAAGLGAGRGDMRPGPLHGFWADADWLFCRDGKWRPVSRRPQPLADGVPESLGHLCDQSVAKIEEEIDARCLERGVEAAEVLRDLRDTLANEAQRCWEAGLPGLHEAPFLLAFLRQLSLQGGRLLSGAPVPREEICRLGVRSVRHSGGASGSSCGSEPPQQRSEQFADAVREVSRILARGAEEEWGDAFAAYAETKHPLVKGKAPARVMRLRGYGNAINPHAAALFIRAFDAATEAAK